MLKTPLSSVRVLDYPRSEKFGVIFWSDFGSYTKCQNKQLELLQTFSVRDEILSGALKRAKNDSKLCTSFKLRRSEKFGVIFDFRSHGVTGFSDSLQNEK